MPITLDDIMKLIHDMADADVIRQAIATFAETEWQDGYNAGLTDGRE